jgi:hypothetical protein
MMEVPVISASNPFVQPDFWSSDWSSRFAALALYNENLANSATVAHESAIITAYEKGLAIFSRVFIATQRRIRMQRQMSGLMPRRTICS